MVIGIFGYNFSHFKTINLVKDTYSQGFKIGAIFLAPRKQFDSNGNVIGIDEQAENKELLDWCSERDIPTFIVDHEDHKRLATIVDKYKISIGLVAGARIIPGAIIDLFKDGIVNYHPGRIPETSGLDAIYRTIEANIPPCITAHLIDHKVDAGLFILEKRVKFLREDDLEIIQQRILNAQIELNQIVLHGIQRGTFKYPEIVRPAKNAKTTVEERDRILLLLDEWKETYGSI